MGLFGQLFGKPETSAETAADAALAAPVPADEGYAQQLQALQLRAQAFWADWQQEEARLSALDSVAFVEAANELLQRHCPDTVVELEGAADGAEGATLVFSANGVREHFPQLQALTEQAQTQRYRVRAFRNRALAAGMADFAIRMGDFELSAADIRVRCEGWRELAALEIAFSRPIEAEMLPHAQNMAFIMLDHVVGEWDAVVKIGAVDFVDEVPEDAVPLHELPEKLDQLWRDLGRSGVYPQPEWQYSMYQLEEAEEQDELTLTRNESAAALIGRADMAWCVSVRCVLAGKADLEAAYDLQDAFYAEAELQQQGIGSIAVTNLSASTRTVYAATANPLALLQKAQALCGRFAGIQAEAACEYDPGWAHYRL